MALVAGPSTAAARVLIVPALFEEANRTRRMLVETLRALARAGVASVLPDLPGCSESTAPLDLQNLSTWRFAMPAAARHFAASHVLSLRGGVLVIPPDLPGWRLEPIAGAQVLRPLLRARTLAAREGGRAETMDVLLENGRTIGIELAGYRLGSAMIRDFECAHPLAAASQADVSLAVLGGGPALWLRSEPGEDGKLSAALAARILADLAS